MIKSEEKLNGEDLQGLEEDSFAKLYEESMRDIEEGKVLKGRVLSINHDFVSIDIGYKSEGQLPVRDFLDENGELSVSVGDEVDVYLVKKEGREGSVVLSKSKANETMVWDAIKEACDTNGEIEGKIVQRIKGGFIVDIKGVSGFLPGSQADVRPVLNQDALVGRLYTFKVLKFNRSKDNVVLSRKAFLEESRGEQREKLLKTIEEGQIIEGVIKNITDYGLFVDLGGIDGLLHITDISWGRVPHPSKLFSIGDTIKVKVLKFDKEAERISLGLKHLKSDPWLNIDEKYPVGAKVKGKVVNITDYGVFVELEEGLEGLVHISEMSWLKRIKHPSQMVSLNDEVDVVVLSTDPANKRLSLGMKQVEPNPWDIVAEKYEKGSKIKGKVTNITDFGVFVEVEEGIDGLVHSSDISWSKGTEHPSKIFEIGQEVEVVVLNIDRKNERFSLGIKQLEKDPWEDVDSRFNPGMLLSGSITNITEFGVFVELEEGIEGLIHISEFGRGKDKDKTDLPEIGQEIEVEILNIDPVERKIGLGIRGEKEAE